MISNTLFLLYPLIAWTTKTKSILTGCDSHFILMLMLFYVWVTRIFLYFVSKDPYFLYHCVVRNFFLVSFTNIYTYLQRPYISKPIWLLILPLVTCEIITNSCENHRLFHSISIYILVKI